MKTFHIKPKTNAKTKMISIIFLPSYKTGLSNNRPMSNDVVLDKHVKILISGFITIGFFIFSFFTRPIPTQGNQSSVVFNVLHRYSNNIF